MPLCHCQHRWGDASYLSLDSMILQQPVLMMRCIFLRLNKPRAICSGSQQNKSSLYFARCLFQKVGPQACYRSISFFWINPVTFEINLMKATSCLRPVFFPCYGCPKYTSNIIFCWTKLAPIYQYICAWEFTNHNLFFHMLRYRNLAVKSKIIWYNDGWEDNHIKNCYPMQ